VDSVKHLTEEKLSSYSDKFSQLQLQISPAGTQNSTFHSSSFQKTYEMT